MAAAKVFVELDKSRHDRLLFDCGEQALNTFIRQHASRHMAASTSRTMVLPDTQPGDKKDRIRAFYTIAPSSISRRELPPSLAKKLPQYPIPVFLLAQLAVDKKEQGLGLGKITLVKALEHLYSINQHMRAYAIVVDCLNEKAEGFYAQFGFELLHREQQQARLFLPMKQLAVLFDP